MKKLIRILTVALICNVVILPSCTTTQPNFGETVVTKSETTDQIILRAEQTAETAFETFDFLVHFEKRNEVALQKLNPAIHTGTQKIRQFGLKTVESLRFATKTFKDQRTAANQTTVLSWLREVNLLMGEANKYIEQSKAIQ